MAEIRHHIEADEGQTFAHMRRVIDEDDLRKRGPGAAPITERGRHASG